MYQIETSYICQIGGNDLTQSNHPKRGKQDMANKMTTWFTNNSMKINPDKFNAIMFGKN